MAKWGCGVEIGGKGELISPLAITYMQIQWASDEETSIVRGCKELN